MPHHKACKKSVRTQADARERNRAYMSNLRAAIKNARQAETPEDAQDLTKKASAMLDRMSSKGIIHKNKAANLKSKLAAHANKVTA